MGTAVLSLFTFNKQLNHWCGFPGVSMPKAAPAMVLAIFDGRANDSAKRFPKSN